MCPSCNLMKCPWDLLVMGQELKNFLLFFLRYSYTHKIATLGTRFEIGKISVQFYYDKILSINVTSVQKETTNTYISWHIFIYIYLMSSGNFLFCTGVQCRHSQQVYSPETSNWCSGHGTSLLFGEIFVPLMMDSECQGHLLFLKQVLVFPCGDLSLHRSLFEAHLC